MTTDYIYIRISQKDKQDLADYARMKGKTVTDIMRDLIGQCLANGRQELGAYLTARATAQTEPPAGEPPAE